jgi:hypothetical protein
MGVQPCKVIFIGYLMKHDHFGSAYYTGIGLIALISLTVRDGKRGDTFYINSCHN